MKNKIIRLLILRDENEGVKTMSGFVVLRENNVLEILGIPDTSAERTKRFYELMNELIKTYPKVIRNVKNKKNINQIMREFLRSGYLVEAGSSKEVIVRLFWAVGKTLEIEYADGSTDIMTQKDENDDSLGINYYKYIDILKKQYNIDNVEDYTTLCGNVSTFSPSARESDVEDDDFDASIFDDEDEVDEENGIINSIINNLRVHKKLISLVVAGAVLVVAGRGVYKLGKKNGEKSVVNSVTTPITTQVPTETPTEAPTAEPTHEIDFSTPTPNPYPSVVTTTSAPVVELPPIRPNYPTTYMTQEEKALEPIPYQIESYDSINSPELWTYIYSDYEDTVNIGDVDISNLNIEKLFEVSNSNMWDLSNYAFNGESNQNLETTPMRIHFEKIVPGLSDVDKYYIKYFNDLRNEIVYQGFNLSNPEKALECNRYAIYELIRCKVYDQPLRLNINGQEVLARYSDLGYEAQYVIEQLCWGNYLLMGTDTVEFDGQIYDQDQLGYEVWGLRPEASPKF